MLYKDGENMKTNGAFKNVAMVFNYIIIFLAFMAKISILQCSILCYTEIIFFPVFIL